MDIFYTVYLLQKKDEFCSCKLKTINFVAKTLNQIWWSNQKFNKSGVIVTNFEIDYLSTRYYLNLKDDEKLFKIEHNIQYFVLPVCAFFRL